MIIGKRSIINELTILTIEIEFTQAYAQSNKYFEAGTSTEAIATICTAVKLISVENPTGMCGTPVFMV